MQGSNTITLNQATMVQALQLWVDDNFVEGKRPQVVSVDSADDGNGRGYNSTAKAFKVECMENTGEPDAPE